MSIKIRSFQGLFKGHFNIIFINIDSMIIMVYSDGLLELDEIAIWPRIFGWKFHFNIRKPILWRQRMHFAFMTYITIQFYSLHHKLWFILDIWNTGSSILKIELSELIIMRKVISVTLQRLSCGSTCPVWHAQSTTLHTSIWLWNYSFELQRYSISVQRDTKSKSV